MRLWNGREYVANFLPSYWNRFSPITAGDMQPLVSITQPKYGR